eukprot:4698934-Pleurochrysis_carterae.AAC.2
MTRCSSLSTACARPLWWNGTHMERRSTKKTASSMWIAIVQRSGEKSRGWRAPIGKFSSALSGWSNRSTSSMIRQPPRKSVSTCTNKGRKSFLRAGGRKIRARKLGSTSCVARLLDKTRASSSGADST